LVSNTQLLIAIGLPMLALAFGLYLNDRRFEGISTRIGDINARIDDLRTDLGGRITRVETSIDQSH
jgi:hypothetical protein